MLSHLGLIAHQPTPKSRHSIAPSRDQIEITKSDTEMKETNMMIVLLITIILNANSAYMHQ
ncbi:unnamed protein product [Absidia cylindrospora]